MSGDCGGNLKFLSGELRFLAWHRCPIESLFSNFDPKNLVRLDMPGSHIKQLWEGTKHLQKLVRINLRDSQYLIKTPDLTEATNLRSLNLQRCGRLVEVHPSISALKNLAYLNLKGCKELKKFPSFIDMKSLEILNLSGCSNLEKFRLEFSEGMKELGTLLLDGTAITEITSSINNHPGLDRVSLRGCRELRSLPSSIHLKSLTFLDLSGCSNLEEFPDISGKRNELSCLKLDGTAIKELPSSIESLQRLQTLTMSNCKSLVCLPDNICKLAWLRRLYLDGCSKLSNLPEILDLEYLFDLRVKGSGIQQLPFCIFRKYSLSFAGCKEMTTPFSLWDSWPTRIRNDRSVLGELDLSDCNLLELSDAIAHLSSLRYLKLCRNNKLESLPAAMNQLVLLERLSLEGCKGLKSIPELPSLMPEALSSCLQIIDACDCTALKTVSTPQPPNSINIFLFYNCFQLGKTNVCTDMVKTAIDNQDSGRLFVALPAGSGIPDWFTRNCIGSSVTVPLPSNKGFGLAICAISNLRGADNSKLQSACCFCTLKGNNGEDEDKLIAHLNVLDRKDALIESDHMYLVYDNSTAMRYLNNESGKYTEARFRIKDHDSLEDCSWITSIGVRLFHVNNEDYFSAINWKEAEKKRETLERAKKMMGMKRGKSAQEVPYAAASH